METSAQEPATELRATTLNQPGGVGAETRLLEVADPEIVRRGALVLVSDTGEVVQVLGVDIVTIFVTRGIHSAAQPIRDGADLVVIGSVEEEFPRERYHDIGHPQPGVWIRVGIEQLGDLQTLCAAHRGDPTYGGMALDLAAVLSSEEASR